LREPSQTVDAQPSQTFCCECRSFYGVHGTLVQSTTATLSVFWCPEPKTIPWKEEGQRKGTHWNSGDELSEVIKLPGRLYRTVTNAPANLHLSELLRLSFGPGWRLRKFEIPPAWHYSPKKKEKSHMRTIFRGDHRSKQVANLRVELRAMAMVHTRQSRANWSNEGFFRPGA
jgi:hypothetical protein